MAKKPARKPEPGPLEQKLTDLETDKRKAKVQEKKAAEPQALQPIEPFYYRNPKHPYGTCWKCGKRKEHAGGLPGGSDSYYCQNCQEWLTVRDSPKDTKIISIR